MYYLSSLLILLLLYHDENMVVVGITNSLWSNLNILPSNKQQHLPFNGGRLGAKSVEDADETDPHIYFAANVRWPGAKHVDPHVRTKEQLDFDRGLMRFTQTTKAYHRKHRLIMDPIALKAMKPKRKVSAIEHWYDADPSMHKVVRIDDLSRFVEATDWAASCASIKDGTEPTICHGPVKPLEPGEEELPPEPKPGPKDGWGVKYINPTWVLPVNHNAPDSAKFFDPANAKNPLWVGEGEGEGEPSGGGGENNPAEEQPIESAAEAAEQEAEKEVAKDEVREEAKEELKEELHDEVKNELKEEMQEDATTEKDPEAPPVAGAESPPPLNGGEEKAPPTAIKKPAAEPSAGEDTLTEKDRVELRDAALPEGEMPPERDRTNNKDEPPHYSHTSGEPPVPDEHPAGTPLKPTSENVGPLTYNQFL